MKKHGARKIAATTTRVVGDKGVGGDGVVVVGGGRERLAIASSESQGFTGAGAGRRRRPVHSRQWQPLLNLLGESERDIALCLACSIGVLETHSASAEALSTRGRLPGAIGQQRCNANAGWRVDVGSSARGSNDKRVVAVSRAVVAPRQQKQDRKRLSLLIP